MAKSTDAMEARFTATYSEFDKACKHVTRTLQKLGTDAERSIKRQEDAFKNSAFSKAFAGTRKDIDALRGSLLSLAPAMAAAFSAQAAVAMLDTYTRFTNALKNAELEGRNLVAVQQALYQSAQKNGTALEPLAQLFSRVSQSAGELGATQQDILDVTSAVTAAVRVQGTTTEAASGALLQLAQALASGTVRAEEFNSINESLNSLLLAAANASTKYGGSVAKMRKDVVDGKLASADFLALIKAGRAELEGKASQAPLTLAASMQTLANAFVMGAGKMDESLGITERLAGGITFLANNLDKLGTAVTVIATAIASRYVVALGAAAVSSARLIAFQTAMTASMTGVTQSALMASTAMTRLNAGFVAMGGGPMVALTAVILALGSFAGAAMKAKQMTDDLIASVQEVKGDLADAKAMLDTGASAVKAVGDQSMAAAIGVRAFAGEVGAAAAALYDLANAQRYAKINELLGKAAQTREDTNKLRQTQRGGMANRKVNSPADLWGVIRDQVADRASSMWTNGQSDRDKTAAIRAGEAGEKAYLDMARQLMAADPEAFVDEARATMGASAAKPNKGGGKGNDDAARRAEASLRAIEDARMAELQGSIALAETLAEQRDLRIQALNLEFEQRKRQIERDVIEGNITQAAANELLGYETIVDGQKVRINGLEEMIRDDKIALEEAAGSTRPRREDSSAYRQARRLSFASGRIGGRDGDYCEGSRKTRTRNLSRSPATSSRGASRGTRP